MWGRQARAAKENRHDGQERALLENALKLSPPRGGGVGERKSKEKSIVCRGNRVQKAL